MVFCPGDPSVPIQIEKEKRSHASDPIDGSSLNLAENLYLTFGGVGCGKGARK